MKSRGLRHAIGAGVFLIGLLLVLPDPAAATGFKHGHRHGSFTHGFHRHQFRHFGHRKPHFFRDRRGFLHRHRHFDHGSRVYHRGFFHPHGFYGASGIFFYWR